MSAQKDKRAYKSSKHPQTKSTTDIEWRDTAEQCLEYLYMSEHLSDITFTFGGYQNVKLPAHKFILSMRSAVFAAMFYGPLAEEGDTVLIEDIRPETIKILLRFIYTDKPELNGDNVLSCLYAAQKYGLTGLIEKCSEFLESNIDQDNVCSIHEQAVFFDMDPLRENCYDYILENASDVLATKAFLKISHKTLFDLLKDDRLSSDETKVFKAAVRWAQEKCKAEQLPKTAENERKILDKVLFEIRFPIIPISEFARVVTPTGILTNKEQVMLFQFNATQGSSQLIKFKKERRFGDTVTVDFTKHSVINQVKEQGFKLLFSDLSYEYDGQSSDTRYPMVKSVKGAFVKHIISVTDNDDSVVNYRTVGTKIVFQTPIKIYNHGTIEFHSSDKGNSTYHERFLDCSSYCVDIDENINGQIVTFGLVPVGLKTISFAKH